MATKAPNKMTEFATAFLRYIDVMLERFSERSGELDAYLTHILGQAFRYMGNAYWHYHSLLIRKATTPWESGVKVHWIINLSSDPVLLHAVIASKRPTYCEHCQNILHPTSQCPCSVAPATKPPGGKGQPSTQERNVATTTTYSKAYYKDRATCNNFNFKSCRLRLLHICWFCQQKDHPIKSYSLTRG